MKRSTLARCIGVLVVSVFFTTCRKFDLKFRDPAKHCRIETFNGVMFKGEPFEMGLTRKFHYNEFGNPIFVEYVETEGGTGTPNFYFDYNDKQQLIHMLGYGDDRYFYNEAGQIVIDSSRQFYAGGDARFETKFFYDIYGRVVKTTTKYYFNDGEQDGVGETTTTLYKYDQHGNLVIPGVTYDNKTSIFRTHPVWMFVNLNYSLNNPVKATSYNDAGLPLTFGEHDINFLASSMTINSVEYNCDEANK